MTHEEALISVAEAAAAISEGVYGHWEKYDALYQRIGAKVSGFPGIWAIIARCAVEVERLAGEDDKFWDVRNITELSDEVARMILDLRDAPDDIPGLIRDAIWNLSNKS